VTTIVYRDGVLAADTRVSFSDWIKPERLCKIERLPGGRLFAAAGDHAIWGKLLRWFRDPHGERPEIPDCDALVVLPDGTVEYYCGAGFRLIQGPFVAIGSGSPVALGALYAGADAEQAVRIAMRVDPYTGGEVDVARLPDPGSLAAAA
jgi:ATP-dependent protease HslVU (ClpYQ) peptidase subunit